MITGKWNIPLILVRMIEILLVFGLLLIIVLPFIFRYFQPQFVNTYISSHAQNRWLTLVFIEICSVGCWFILLFLRRLLKTVIKTSPFVYKNVKDLKYISYLCALIAFVLVVKSFMDFSVMTPVIAVLGALSSMFCQTLAAVFDKAIKLKDENDLTI